MQVIEKSMKSKKELKSKHPHYADNQHYCPVLNDIYGRLKATVISSVVPANYMLTNVLCRLQFRWGDW